PLRQARFPLPLSPRPAGLAGRGDRQGAQRRSGAALRRCHRILARVRERRDVGEAGRRITALALRARSAGFLEEPVRRPDRARHPASGMVGTSLARRADRIATVDEIWKTTPCKVAIIAGMIP